MARNLLVDWTSQPMVAFSTIVVPIDFSESSTLALNFARDLARTFGAALHLVHVVEDSDAHLRLGQTESQRRAAERLHAMVLAGNPNTRECCVILSSGLPAFAIVEYAKTITADLIVMATRECGAASCPFLGFAAERILRTALCPVFVVRDPESGAPSRDAHLTAAGAAGPDGSSSLRSAH